ncbi:hypothetical protein ACFLRW_03590 [Acidobacteriota bacterium]
MEKNNFLKLSLLAAILIILVSGCATIYTTPDFNAARNQHRILAILPFDVTIAVRRLPKGVTVEMLREMEQDEAYVIQGEVYRFFLRQMSKNAYTINFQDIDETNSTLLREGISFENIRNYSKAEIAQILKVDSVLSGTVHRAKPMSMGASIVTAVLLDWPGITNKVDVGVAIHNGTDASLLWKYNHSYAGSIGSSSENLTRALMRHVSKKFPYKR